MAVKIIIFCMQKAEQPQRDPDEVKVHNYDRLNKNIPNEVLEIVPDSEDRPENFQQRAAGLLAELNKEPYITGRYSFSYEMQELIRTAEAGATINEGSPYSNKYKGWQPADIAALVKSIENHPLYLAKAKEGKRVEALYDTVEDFNFNRDHERAVLALAELNQLKNFDPEQTQLGKPLADLEQDELIQQGLDKKSIERKVAELLKANGLDESSLYDKRAAVGSRAFGQAEDMAGEKMSDLQ